MRTQERKVYSNAPPGLKPEGVLLRDSDIEYFIQALKKEGLNEGTLLRYRGDLKKLQAYVGAGNGIDNLTLLKWQNAMHEAGYAGRSITARLMTANRYLGFYGRDDLRHTPPPVQCDDLPSMSRKEYQRMLRAAYEQHNRRGELILRLFVEAGLQQWQFELVTVEAVSEGVIMTKKRNRQCMVVFNWPLQDDLLDYAESKAVHKGPILLSRNGLPINRSAIAVELNRLAVQAGVELNKVAPRSLQKLHDAIAMAPSAGALTKMREESAAQVSAAAAT